MLNFSRYCTYKGLQQQNHLHDDITLSVKCYFVTMSLFYCFWHIISCLCIRTLVTVNDLQHKSRESSSCTCMTFEFWSLWLALHVISVMLYFLRHGHWLSFQQLKRPLLSCVITQYNLRIEWHCGQLCWSWKPLWYTWAAHSQYLQVSLLPSMQWQNEYLLSGWLIIINKRAISDGDNSSQQTDSWPK